jgi:hypothetical protein
VFVPWHLQDNFEEEAKGSKGKKVDSKAEESKFIETGIKNKDKQATVYHRYYHVFREHELEQLIMKHFEGRLKIVDRYFDHANWVVVAEKL